MAVLLLHFIDLLCFLRFLPFRRISANFLGMTRTGWYSHRCLKPCCVMLRFGENSANFLCIPLASWEPISFLNLTTFFGKALHKVTSPQKFTSVIFTALSKTCWYYARCIYYRVLSKNRQISAVFARLVEICRSSLPITAFFVPC